MSAPIRSYASTSFWLAAALIVMPFLQLLPIDFDRTGTLFLLPFLWSGRDLLRPALNRLSQGSRWVNVGAGIFLSAVIIAVALADQFAPATVTAACWVLLAASSLIAGEMMLRDSGAGSRLLGAIALSVTAGTMVVWLLWWWGGRGAVPLYAHHRIFGLHTLSGAVAAVALIVRIWEQTAKRNAWLLAGVINWSGLLWSGSRGPALALFLALLTWWFLGDARLRKHLLRAGTILLGAGLLLSFALWSPRPELGWWNALHRTTTASAAPALSLSAITATRSDFWRDSFHRVQLRPWFGHGPDAYRFLTPKLDGQQPHNFILQLLLDAGFIGAGAALTFLIALFMGGWRQVKLSRGHAEIAPWVALGSASLIAGLLDGVFYHLVALLPATIAIGAILPGRNPAKEAPKFKRWTVIGSSALTASIAILMLHTWIFYLLAVAPAPANSHSLSARLVQKFPSSTFALWRWLDAWQPAAPDDALAWSQWAQEHSANAPSFHIYAARLLLSRGDHDGAVKELRSALNKAHWSNQPAIAEMLRGLEAPAH